MSSWKLKGNEFFKQKLYKEAIDCYTKNLKEETVKKEIINTYNNRFRCFWMLQNFDDALKDVKESLKVDSKEEKTQRLYLKIIIELNQEKVKFLKNDLKTKYEELIIQEFSNLYPNEITKSVFQGPIDGSNWLIPGKVLMSQYPGDLDEEIAQDKAKKYLEHNIKTFVNLQQKEELKRFKSYEKNIKNLNKNVEFLSFEIPDMGIRDDDDVDEYTDFLIERVLNKDIMALHCWGGHGRTGTISAILLGKLFFLEPKVALDRVYHSHQCRKTRNGASSPQAYDQFQQVERILTKFLSNLKR